MIKAVLLDYNNTLTQVDEKRKEKVIESFGLSQDDYKKRHGMSLIYSLGRIKSDNEYLKLCSNLVGKQFTKEFLDVIQKTEIIDDKTIELVKKLKRKYKLAIVANNVKNWVMKKLEKYKIKNFFDIIVVSSEVGVRKPDPRIFSFTIKKLNVKPEECIFISDELNDDLSGAKVLGIKTIWLKKEKEEITFQPDFIINSLNEVEEILK